MEKFKTPVSIEVNGKEELKKVLEKLESMGVRWNSVLTPTQIYEKEWFRKIKGHITAVDLMNDTRIYGYSRDGYMHYKNRIKAAEFLREKPECIVIYRKGKETIALDKTTGKKAVAKCSPEDKYDFEVGAKLAFTRLMGETEEMPKPKHVNCRCSLKTEPEFKPHLVYKGKTKVFYFGQIGEPTPIKDAIGRELRVGDTVELYRKQDYICEKSIVKDENKAFVMGIAFNCNRNGTLENGYQIIKKRSYEDIAHGEKVDGIIYVKERGNHE